MEPQHPVEDWWTDFAQNERLCKTIAEHFGWEYITILFETGNKTEKDSSLKLLANDTGVNKYSPAKSPFGLEKHAFKKSPSGDLGVGRKQQKKSPHELEKHAFKKSPLGDLGVRDSGPDSGTESSTPTQTACFINTGREWVSLPHSSYGGAAGIDNVDQLIGDLKKKPVRWQVRADRPLSEFYRSEKVASWLPLKREAEKQLKCLPLGVRRKIRKAQKNGIVVREGGPEMLDDFYGVYTRNLHRLGAPAMSKHFVEALLTKYPDDKKHQSRLFVAYYENRAVGAALLLGAGNSYENLLFGSLKKYNRYYTTYLLHWEMIRHAISEGASVYSFGRSTSGSGVHRYKRQWGTHDLPLFWSYSHPVRKSIKDLKFLATLWRLLPYPLARTLGPWFAARIY